MPPKKKKSMGVGVSSIKSAALGEPDRHFKYAPEIFKTGFESLLARTLIERLKDFQGRGSYTDLLLRADDGEVECHKVQIPSNYSYKWNFDLVFRRCLHHSPLCYGVSSMSRLQFRQQTSLSSHLLG